MLLASVNISMLVEDVLVMKAVQDGSLMSGPEDLDIIGWIKEQVPKVQAVARTGVKVVASVDTTLPAFICIDAHYLSHIVQVGARLASLRVHSFLIPHSLVSVYRVFS